MSEELITRAEITGIKEELAALKKELDAAFAQYLITGDNPQRLASLQDKFERRMKEVEQRLLAEKIPGERITLTIGGRSKEQLLEDLNTANIQVSTYAKDMIQHPDFTTLPTPQTMTLVKLAVRDLGFDNETTTDQIYQKAKERGLDLCPPEVGPYLRLQDKSQPLGNWYYIAMEQISDRRGYPMVFNLERFGDGAWLHGGWANPNGLWSPGGGFVFSLRKKP